MELAFDNVYAPRNNQDKSEDDFIFGSAENYLSGLPGYEDLLFLIEFLKLNSHDGNLMYDSIRSCIRTYCKQFETAKDVKKIAKTFTNVNFDYESGDVINFTKRADYTKLLQDNVYYIQMLCNELGFKQVPNQYSPNHLFDCIDEIRNSLGLIFLDLKVDMRKMICDELEFYPDVYKSMIDDDPLVPDYETYCSRIRDSKFYGCKYVLMAAATFLKIRIVLLHFSSVETMPEVYNPLRQPVIMSQKKGNNESNILNNETSYLTVKYLTFSPPYYFNNTENADIDSNWPSIASKRAKYQKDSLIRSEMKKTVIRKNGEVRNISSFCDEILKIKNPDKILSS